MKPREVVRLLKKWAAALKHNACALYLASNDERVPFAAKIVVGLVIAYALSPIDLIPDFIPVVGYLDDLILLPLGILLVIRLTPYDVRTAAARNVIRSDGVSHRPGRLVAAGVVVAIWVAGLALLIRWIFRLVLQS